MSNIPLTEGNLQSLQRSQQYGSNATPVGADSGLMTSGLHALLDGPATKDPSAAPYLTPEDANSIVSGLLQQYYHVQEWSVPWPKPKATPLLFVPDPLTEAFAVPKAPTLSDLDAMSLGLVESIPLAHDLMYPEHERLRSELSKKVAANEFRVAEQGLHAPYQTAVERNPDLSAEDFALIDVDFCSSGHGQRHLPSITFLMRPSYTEIGLAPAERREEERRNAIAQSMGPITATQQSFGGGGDSVAPTTLATQQSLLAGASSSQQQQPQLSQWNVTASKTFRHAKQIDVCYDQWVQTVAESKLGLMPEVGKGSSLTPEMIQKLTVRILHVIGYITANGTVIGARRNDTNQNFYNTQQGKFVGGLVWKHLCALAAEAWGQLNTTKSASASTKVPQMFNLSAATITARILDDANFDMNALGADEVKATFQSLLEEVIESYCIALKKSTNANKKTPCPLIHTAEDFVAPKGLGTAVLPASVELVTADASALAQRPRTAHESEVEAPLCLASNVALSSTLKRIAEGGETSSRRAVTGGRLPVDELFKNTFKLQSVENANGAVPLSVMPVFPENFTRIAKDPSAPAHTHDFANAYRGLHHVVLNGERNTFIPGAYIPTDVRTPNVLFNDRLHFKPTAEVGEKRSRRDEPLSGGVSPTAVETTAYTTGTTQSKFEKYLADQSSTISYVLKVNNSLQQQGEDGDDNATGITGPVVTYARIPTLMRFKRAQARITAEDTLKTVTVSWAEDEAEAKAEQMDLAGEEEEEGDDNTNAQA